MSDDDKDTSKESKERKRKKLSDSPFLKNLRRAQPKLLEESTEKERIVVDEEELGMQLIEAAKEPFDNGQEVKRLLDEGAPVNYQEKITGATALHLAAGYSDVATVKIILAHPDVDCLIRDNQRRLAAELAGAVNPELADLILDKEAEQAKIKKIIPHMRHNEPIDDDSGGHNEPDGPI